MKRDLNIIRAIVLELAAMPEASRSPNLGVPQFPGCSELEVSEHVRIAYKMGLVEAFAPATADSFNEWIPLRLTPAGHAFYEQIHDQKAWDVIIAQASIMARDVAIQTAVGLLTK